MFITDLNLQDWEIKRIITGYRKLLKLSEAIADYESAPFTDLIWHIESLLPAFANEHKSGEIGEGYRALQQKVMSDISIDELMEILLCR